MRTNLQRLTALLLVLALVLLPVAPALAAGDTVYIRNADDLLQLSARCASDTYSRGLTVVLQSSLDLTGVDFSPIPIFCGSFDGEGHTISGLKLSAKGSGVGFFRYLSETATVKNLNLEAEVTPDGSKCSVGILAGENAGTIQNCTVSGIVSGAEDVGGIAGRNLEGGKIIDCVNHAGLRGTTRAGGITGQNEGSVEGCENHGIIDDHNDESFTDVGGIAGRSNGLLESCVNRGDVGYIHNGYNVGGIVGIQSGVVVDCVNHASVWGRKDVGGIAGQFEPWIDMLYGKALLEQLGDEFAELTDVLRDLSDEVNHSTNAFSDDLKELLDLTEEVGDTVSNTLDSTSNTMEQMMDDLELQSDRITTSVDDLLDALDSFSDDANRQIDDIIAAVDAMRNALADGLDEADEAVSKAGDRMGAQLDQVTSELNKMKKELANAEASADRISAFAQKTLAILANSSLSLEEKAAAIQNAYQNAGDLDVQAHISGAMTALDRAVTALNAALKELSTGYENTADALRDMLERSGRSADKLSASMSDLNDTMKRFSDASSDKLRTVNEALDKIGKTVKDSMSAIGTDMDNASDALDVQTQAIHDKVDGMADDFSASGDELHGIMNRMFDRFDAIHNVLSDAGAPEYTVEDISQEAGASLADGTIRSCRNFGAVEGDINAGGIAGMVAYELLDDPELDFEVPEELLVDTTARIRAAVDNCRNSGRVSVKNDCAGGIAGRADIGAITTSVNTGDVEVESGNYCGGIAGQSKGTITNSHAQCLLTGNDYIGGIAGEGADITRCYSMVEILSDGGECLGAVAGDITDESEQSGNHFIQEGLGGIDGINYEGRATDLPYAEFIQLENLPQDFLQFGVSFVAEEVAIASFPLDYGAAFDLALSPDCPQLEGQNSRWEEFDAQSIRRNLIVNAEYIPWRKTISTGETKALMLAEGNFSDRASITSTHWPAEELVIPRGYALLGSYHYEVHDPGAEQNEELILRIYADTERTAAVAVETPDGLRIVETSRDGSYLVFTGDTEGNFLLLEKTRSPVVIIAAVLLGALLLAGVVVLICRRKRLKSKPEALPEEAECVILESATTRE